MSRTYVQHYVKTKSIIYQGHAVKIVLDPEGEPVGIYSSCYWRNGEIYYRIAPIADITDKGLLQCIEELGKVS